jgi:hypothetical protein
VWTLYCYDDGKRPDIWERWFFDESLVTDAIRARHERVWVALRGMKIWDSYRLVHDCPVDGVKEVVIKVKKDLQWRLGGIYGPAQREFTVLGAFYHKGTRYYPDGILSQVKTAKSELEKSNFKKRFTREPPKLADRAKASS